MKWLARRHPVVLVLLGTVVALLAATGAAAAWSATRDHGPRPEVTLHFTAEDRDDVRNPLVAGDPRGDQVPQGRFERLDQKGRDSLAAHQGRPLVVNFFASTCVPCVKEMPALERVHRTYGNRVDFVGLALNDSAREARALVQRTGVSYETGRDGSGALAAAFGVVNMPSTFLVAADGTIVDTHPGAVTESSLRRLIKTKLLA